MISRSVLLAAVALLVSACGERSVDPTAAKARTNPPAETPAPPSNVTLVEPTYRIRTTTLETSGKAQFNEEALARVQAPATGRVVEVLARPGDVVEPGHRLLVIDSPDLGTAKSDYAKAVSDVDRSSAALALARELYEVRAVAQKDVRDAENDYRKAVAERERAAARLRTLNVPPDRLPEIARRADTTTTFGVVAPRSGVIVERNVNPGQVVSYGQSDTPVSLFVVADLSTLWVLADVYEPDIPQVRLGQRVQVTLPCCPDQPFNGTVTYIADTVDKDTRTVKVRVVVANRGRLLKAEMFVKVTLATGTTRVLTLPQSAIQRQGGETFVLVRKGGEYERRQVKVGAELDGSVQVVSGVRAGDRVVGTGSILLKQSTP